MATSKKSLSGISKLSDPIDKGKKPLTDAQLTSFGNFANTTDVKEKAAYLAKKGLIGASQLITDHPDISSSKGIINAQSDWKSAALSQMLIRARQLGLKTPTEINANKSALIGSLQPAYQQALQHPVFNQIHSNWWDTFNSVLKDQYAAEKTSSPIPSLANALASK